MSNLEMEGSKRVKKNFQRAGIPFYTALLRDGRLFFFFFSLLSFFFLSFKATRPDWGELEWGKPCLRVGAQS